ncbi:MAG: hypothetical protein MJ240_03465 [Kiritimatiellae bacterium]|nr:hypothetical protein [Kiritimatiellia bacterium]
MKFLSHIHAKLGDLWWYAILMFVAQRFSDVINMFVGLWLVPRYVPMEELGAVLPITALVGFVGLPLTILATPFLKFVTQFNDGGEKGMVKALIRDAFLGTIVLAFAIFLLSWFVAPFFFERMRVKTGMLGALVLGVSIVNASGMIFANAVQGTKRFTALTWFAVLGAPIRLLVMLLAMPFRALSGYVVGQGAPCLVCMVGSFWTLRDFLSREVPCVSYWKKYGHSIIMYTLPFALWTIMTTMSGSVEALVIRHRLSDFESAGYYIITRFSDIAGYLGFTFSGLLFPMVASENAYSEGARRMLVHSVMGTCVCGLACVGALYVFGDLFLELTPCWSPYKALVPHMTALAFHSTVCILVTCLLVYEIAQGRFRFLWYAVPILALKCLVLYSATGYNFFGRWLSEKTIHTIAQFNPCRLSVIIGILLIAQMAILLALLTDMFVLNGRPSALKESSLR